MALSNSYIPNLRKKRMWVRAWVGLAVWACCSTIIHTPSEAFFTRESRGGSEETEDVLGALNKIAQALDSHERHTTLYERVSMLEESLSKKTENEAKLESEVLELRTKIPALEVEINTIPEMRKDLAEFEAKIEKLIHDYEAKLSTLASEVIRLKKNGARRKDLQTLSDGSDAFVLRIDTPSCPEVGQGLTAERVGDHCLYFSWGTALNWTDAHRHCQSLGGDLSAPDDLLSLKTFLHGSFARVPSIWLGASYNLDDELNATSLSFDTNTTRKSQSLPDAQGDQSQVDPIEDGGDGVFSFSLNILGSPAVTNNRIDGDKEGHEGTQDDEPLRDLSGDIVLQDEPISLGDEELTSEISKLSKRFLDRENILSSSSRSLISRFQNSSSRTPVVDFILLKDPVVSSEQTGDFEPGKSPSPSAPTSERSQSIDTRPGLHTLLMASSPVESSGRGTPPDVSRDVREVLEDRSGQQDSSSITDPQEETRVTGKAKMNCILLQQNEAMEYELVGQPCNEQHRFVCEIFSKSSERKFSPDNLLHE